MLPQWLPSGFAHYISEKMIRLSRAESLKTKHVVGYLRTYHHIVNISIMVVMVFLQIPVCHGIQCYICENELSNDMCSSEVNLQPCEEGMDTCQTIISYSEVSEKLSITKSCTKNVSCELQINATTDDMPCDQSLSSWVCTNCCHDDACNYDAGNELNGFHWLPIIFATFSVLIISINL